VFPDSREQRCWVHKIANVLDAVPSSVQPKVKAALHNIMNAENKEAADLAIDHFDTTYHAKYRKAVDKVLKDREVLLTHFDFPVEHWIHLRTTNVIESSFATVRLRTNKTKGAGSRGAGLAMAYKLLDAAQVRWRCVNAPHLVALVRAEATFVDGLIIEREDHWDAA
jgi:transposase-like protein